MDMGGADRDTCVAADCNPDGDDGCQCDSQEKCESATIGGTWKVESTCADYSGHLERAGVRVTQTLIKPRASLLLMRRQHGM